MMNPQINLEMKRASSSHSSLQNEKIEFLSSEVYHIYYNFIKLKLQRDNNIH